MPCGQEESSRSSSATQAPSRSPPSLSRAALQAAVGGGVGGDRPEEHLLVSEGAQVGEAVAAVGEQHGEVADHASGLVAHLARVAAQGLRQALREAQAVGQSAEQDGARA